MSKHIQLIDLDEIETLRITCKGCDEYWPVFVKSEKYEFQKKCSCNGPVIPDNSLEYIEGFIKNIKSISRFRLNLKHKIQKPIIRPPETPQVQQSLPDPAPYPTSLRPAFFLSPPFLWIFRDI
jgi:hypothetical protein